MDQHAQPGQPAPGIAALVVDATQILQQYLGKLQACGVNGIARGQATQHDSGLGCGDLLGEPARHQLA